MKHKTLTIGGISLAVALGAIGAAAVSGPGLASATPTVSAQTAGTEQATGATSESAIAQRGERLRRILRGAVESASSTIGITPRELVSEVRGGKSVAQVATDHGVEPQAVVDGLVAAGSTKVDEAVAAGKLTAEQGDQIKARLPEMAQKLVDRQGGSGRGPRGR